MSALEEQPDRVASVDSVLAADDARDTRLNATEFPRRMVEFFGTEAFRPCYKGRDFPKLSYGLRFEQACSEHVHGLKAQRVYVLISNSLAKKTSALERVKRALQGKIVGTRVGIGAHTPIMDCVEVIREVHELGDVDCIVTIGGGSVTDAGKLVRFAIANQAYTMTDIDTLWGGESDNPNMRSNIRPPSIPLLCVPTSLSGGEYQQIAAATDAETHAKRIFEPKLDPTIIIQDPELCLTTPDLLWLSSGIRAVDHCVETLCSLVSNDEGDAEAEDGLQKLISGLIRCKDDTQDLEARHLCQLGVVEAMAAVSSGVPLGASHGIGHQLGPLGVGHGETSCILLPAVCKFNAAHGANNARQEACKRIILKDEHVKQILQGEKMSQPDLANLLSAIIKYLGLPRSLQDVGISRDKLQLLAENSLQDSWVRTNPAPLKELSQVMEILEMVVGEAIQRN